MADRLRGGRPAVHVQDVAQGAVGMQVGGQYARRVVWRPFPVAAVGAHDHGAGPVAEQYAGGPVLPVEDAGKNLGADEQHRARLARLDEIVGDGEPVNKTRAHGLEVERGTVAHAQHGLDLGGALASSASSTMAARLITA